MRLIFKVFINTFIFIFIFISHPLPIFAETSLQKTKTAISQKKINKAQLEKLILQYTNKQRIAYKLNPLTPLAELHISARRHSENMLQHSFFAHTDHLQRSPMSRFREWFPEVIGSIGENLAKFEGLARYNNDSLAQKVVEGWMNSPPHRKNLLNPEFKQLGIGVAMSKKICYMSQNFGVMIGRIKKLPPKTIRYGNTVVLEMEFFDLFPRKDLSVFLSVPNKDKKFFFNKSSYYYTGIQPITIKWKKGNRMQANIPFEEGFGTYEIQFGKTDREIFPATISITTNSPSSE